ncbi:MAG: S41 family peptidase [Alphaproteobacteria bacterium]|nr:S41 family peptidase [Alphaproteobacteria bacterium]
MPKNLFRLFAVLAVFAALAATPLFAKDAPAKQDDQATATATVGDDGDTSDTFKQLTLFSDVLERVRADYVDPVTDKKLIENALNGMLSALDPHSSYMNKEQFADMQTQTRGEFGGLGIEVTMENGIVKVVSPIDDTPAAKAGLQPGDLITHLDGKIITDFTLDQAVDRMRGAPGTKITLTIRRGGLTGHPFDVTLTRAIIKVQSVKWEAKDDIAYIRITSFDEQTQPGLEQALDEANKKIGKRLIGYVIDLRNNPGGLLDEAVSVAGTFLPAGDEVVSTRGRHKDDDQSFVAKGGDQTHGLPIAVLINGGSASASEIVAGALQDHKRAILIGTKSFGKGSVQTIIPVQGGGAIRLTTARYYTPSGRSIQALGIEPDIVVQPAKLERIAMGPGLHEADLKGALSNPTLKNGKAPKPEDADQTDGDLDLDGMPADDDAKDKGKDKDGKKPAPFDYQLARALDLIHGLHLFEVQQGK